MEEVYVSCIRIDGVPILPPLMTTERRLEMQKYRKKAIAVEKRIKTRIEQHKLTVALNKTLENTLSFDSFALEECDKKPPMQRIVPLNSKKSSQLSCNIFDVTEYNDDGYILFNDTENYDSEVNLAVVQLSISADHMDHEMQISPRLTQSQPRLLRSNSYTLDAPSPLLVEHFMKYTKSHEESVSLKIIESDYKTQDSIDSDTNSDNALKNSTTTMSESIHELIRDLANIRFSKSCGNATEDVYIDGSVNTPSKQAVQDIADHLSTNGNTMVTEALDKSSVLLIDFESDTGDNLTLCCDDTTSKCSILDHEFYYPSYQESRRSNCSRALFVDVPKMQRKLHEEWAAIVLTAAVKGYLVRRLKRTERIKNLIQTIRDALLCAMSLHSERTDAIQPPDVELHRRLIQQISAACFEFYNVFFNLSVKEKMEIIALDRQRLQEKLKRPNSALTVDSQMSTQSSRNTFTAKQKKTLVSSLVA